MPKQTFLNLPDVKRKAFLDAAIEEFAGSDYDSASISHIVAQVGIAKGSFYQYFEDKRDLYLYLIDLALQEQITFVQRASPPELPFFEYTQWVLEMGVRFSFSYPRLNQIIYRAIFSDTPFRDETLQRMKEGTLDYTRHLLKQGIASGEVNPDIDIELVVYLLSLLTSDFGSFLVTRLKLDPQRLMQGDYSQIDMEILRGTFAKATEFLRYGLAKRPPE